MSRFLSALLAPRTKGRMEHTEGKETMNRENKISSNVNVSNANHAKSNGSNRNIPTSIGSNEILSNTTTMISNSNGSGSMFSFSNAIACGTPDVGTWIDSSKGVDNNSDSSSLVASLNLRNESADAYSSTIVVPISVSVATKVSASTSAISFSTLAKGKGNSGQLVAITQGQSNTQVISQGKVHRTSKPTKVAKPLKSESVRMENLDSNVPMDFDLLFAGSGSKRMHIDNICEDTQTIPPLSKKIKHYPKAQLDELKQVGLCSKNLLSKEKLFNKDEIEMKRRKPSPVVESTQIDCVAEYLNGLNEEQRKAVVFPSGPVLITAAAGSGKTLTLTTRIVHFLKNGWKPENLLAITFTRKAADEMRSRVEKLAGWASAAPIQICNFHQLALKILRQNWQSYFSQQFQVLGASEQAEFIKEAVDLVGISSPVYDMQTVNADDQIDEMVAELDCEFAKVNSKEHANSPKIYSYFINIIRFAKRNGKRSIHYKDDVQKVFAQYEQLLTTRVCIDFTDMIALAMDLLKRRNDLLEHYSQQFKLIFCDEFQDADKEQFDLLCLLGKHKQITACGDEDQSIYGWRGSNVKIFNWFRSHFPEHMNFFLTESYRSTGVICRAINSLISNNKVRYPKNIWTNNSDGGLIEVLVGSDPAAEADQIVKQVKILRDEGIPWSQIAILGRTRKIISQVDHHFKQVSIPTVRHISKLASFSISSTEVKDIMAYIKLLSDLNCNTSFQRVVNVPKRGIGVSVISELKSNAVATGKSLFDSAVCLIDPLYRGVSNKTKNSLSVFIRLIRDLQSQCFGAGVAEIVRIVLLKTNYLQQISEQKQEVVNRFIDIAKAFDSRSETGQMMDFVSCIKEFFVYLKEEKHETKKDVCFLSTIHQAKGMEWNYVFVLRFNEGSLPLDSYQNQGDEYDEEADGPERSLEEERRLAYVACSRAKKKLYLSFCTMEGGMAMNPSRFLNEICQDTLNGWNGKAPKSKNADSRKVESVYFRPASKFVPPTISELDALTKKESM